MTPKKDDTPLTPWTDGVDEMQKSVALLSDDDALDKLATMIPGQNANDLVRSMVVGVVRLAKDAEDVYCKTEDGLLLLADDAYAFGYVRLVPTVLLPILDIITYKGEQETITCDNCQHQQVVKVKGYPPTWEVPEGETATGLTLLYGTNLVNMWDAPLTAERKRTSGTIALPSIGSRWRTVEYMGRSWELTVVPDGNGGRKVEVVNPPPHMVTTPLTSVSMVAREIIIACHYGEPDWTSNSKGMVAGPKGPITLRDKASRNGREFCQLDKAGNILDSALVREATPAK